MRKLLSILVLISVAGGAAQQIDKKVYTTQFCKLAAPVIDGRGDDAVWQQAEPGEGFTQHEPDNGAPASEASFFKIVYDADNLYVLIRNQDRQPD
ncbi:MAG TPA: sugar-binding protein, partial [bacterium]|nr:sugar-binding protein [bacterium]